MSAESSFAANLNERDGFPVPPSPSPPNPPHVNGSQDLRATKVKCRDVPCLALVLHYLTLAPWTHTHTHTHTLPYRMLRVSLPLVYLVVYFFGGLSRRRSILPPRLFFFSFPSSSLTGIHFPFFFLYCRCREKFHNRSVGRSPAVPPTPLERRPPRGTPDAQPVSFPHTTTSSESQRSTFVIPRRGALRSVRLRKKEIVKQPNYLSNVYHAVFENLSSLIHTYPSIYCWERRRNPQKF